MVEKKVKKIDPKYYTIRAVEKKNSQLFINARTRKSKDIKIAQNCKKKVIKKEKNKLNFF